MSKVSKEQALIEVHKWLSAKKVKAKKIEDSEDAIEQLSDAIVEGQLILTKDNVFKQVLDFPIQDDEGNDVLKELTYKPRLRAGDVDPRLQKIKSNDIQGMIRAYVSALTGQNTGILKKLDTEDNRVAQTIVTFFL